MHLSCSNVLSRPQTPSVKPANNAHKINKTDARMDIPIQAPKWNLVTLYGIVSMTILPVGSVTFRAARAGASYGGCPNPDREAGEQLELG
jgi:hypothetical protein